MPLYVHNVIMATGKLLQGKPNECWGFLQWTSMISYRREAMFLVMSWWWGQEPGRKWGRKSMGGGRREGGKQDSQGGRNWEK